MSMLNVTSAPRPSVVAADPSGDGGVPEEAGRVLRGPEAVSEECVHPERVLSVSLRPASHFLVLLIVNI